MNDTRALAALRPVLQQRSGLLQATRAFFLQRDYLEVQTPVRLAAPATEQHIDVQPAGAGFLRTSPELHMKRLLAAGVERQFQLGPCFRQGERGPRHEPEFTMLEWYRAHADYRTVLDETTALLRHLDAASTVEIIPVAEAFQRWANWNPCAPDSAASPFDPDRFDWDLVHHIEPNLPDGAVVLIDYPAPLAAMARTRGPIAERWELYLDRIELANAYSELTDPTEQRRRFAAWSAARLAAERPVYPIDHAFLAALEQGMPDAGGVALGFDRLLLHLNPATNFDQLLPFREPLP